MNAQEICSALNVSTKENFKRHANKLSEMYRFLSKQPMPQSVDRTNTRIEFGVRTKMENGERSNVDDGVWMDAETFKLKYQFGKSAAEYSVSVPIGNKFHDKFCLLFGIVNTKEVTEHECSHTVFVPTDFIAAIKKAAKFTGKDFMRPWSMCVGIEIIGNKLQVVATDAHVLYMSAVMDVKNDIPDTKIMIPADRIKQLPKSSLDFVSVTIREKQISFLGIDLPIELEAGKYPDWKSIVPELSKCISFDAETFQKQLKAIQPYTNKATNQVTVYVHDYLTLHGSDIDFDFECTKSLQLGLKDFDDYAISYNGKYLQLASQNLKQGEQKMYISDNSRLSGSAMFDDGTEKVLIMPLQQVNAEDFDYIKHLTKEHLNLAKFEPKQAQISLQNNNPTKHKKRQTKRAKIEPNKAKFQQTSANETKPQDQTKKEPIQAPNADQKAVKIFSQYYHDLARLGYKVSAKAADGKFKIRWVNLSGGMVTRGERTYIGNPDTIATLEYALH